MVKFPRLKEDRLTNSHLSDTEKFNILERAQEIYAKLKVNAPLKDAVVEETNTERGPSQVAPSTAKIFQALRL